MTMRRKYLSEEIWDTPEDTASQWLPESMARSNGFVDECTQKARQMIREHEDVLHRCAELLLEKEKIERSD